MPLPDNQLLHAEIIVYGQITSGGSTTTNTVNSFVYRRTGTANPVNKTNLDTIFQSSIVVPMGATLNNRWTQLFNTVRWLNDALDPPTNFSHAVVGGRTGDSLSTVASAFTLFRTGLRGRSYRGGKHYGPLSESDVTNPDDDILNAASLALFATLNTALATPLVDASPNTWVLQVLSRTLSQLTKNPTSVKAEQVTSILMNKRVGRMGGREVKSVY